MSISSATFSRMCRKSRAIEVMRRQAVVSTLMRLNTQLDCRLDLGLIQPMQHSVVPPVRSD